MIPSLHKALQSSSQTGSQTLRITDAQAAAVEIRTAALKGNIVFEDVDNLEGLLGERRFVILTGKTLEVASALAALALQQKEDAPASPPREVSPNPLLFGHVSSEMLQEHTAVQHIFENARKLTSGPTIMKNSSDHSDLYSSYRGGGTLIYQSHLEKCAVDEHGYPRPDIRSDAYPEFFGGPGGKIYICYEGQPPKPFGNVGADGSVTFYNDSQYKVWDYTVSSDSEPRHFGYGPNNSRNMYM